MLNCKSIMDTKLIELAKKAGQLALDEQKKLFVQVKRDKSIVTNGDLMVSQFLEKELKKLYPDFEIFSEESYMKKPKGKKVIVIDPIDGTESYSRKENTWTILIGFLENLVPVKGLVYQPTEDIVYYGEHLKGAYSLKNGKTTKLQVSSDDVPTVRGITSPSNYGEDNLFKSLNISNVEKMFSASLKVMEVAKGNIEVYPNFRKKCSMWDLIAPEIILNEAGGKIIYEKPRTYDFSRPLVDSKFVAVTPKFFNLKV